MRFWTKKTDQFSRPDLETLNDKALKMIDMLELKLKEQDTKIEKLSDQLETTRREHEKDRNIVVQLQNQIIMLESAHNDKPFPAWLKDRSGVMLYLNPAYEKMFLNPIGLTIRDYIGKTDFDVWPEEVARRYADHDRRAMGQKGYWKGEELIILDGNDISRYWQVVKWGRFVGNICVGIAGEAHPVEASSIKGIDYALNLIKRGDIHNTIEFLAHITYGEDKKTITGLKRRITSIENRRKNGTVSEENYQLEVNKISQAIIDMISS